MYLAASLAPTSVSSQSEMKGFSCSMQGSRWDPVDMSRSATGCPLIRRISPWLLRATGFWLLPLWRVWALCTFVLVLAFYFVCFLDPFRFVLLPFDGPLKSP